MRPSCAQSIHNSRVTWAGFWGIVFSAISIPALAAGTLADTAITNTAQIDFNVGGLPQTTQTANDTIRVEEVLNVVVASADAGNVAVLSPDTARVLRFNVTNTGNAPEAYRLSLDNAITVGDQFNPITRSPALYIDDGDGNFDPGVDTVYVSGTSPDPLLATDETILVYAVSDIPTGLVAADLGISELTARSRTLIDNAGTGTPGEEFAGAGVNGRTAIVGLTGASATAQGIYEVPTFDVSITKSIASVLDPQGGSEYVPGSIVTYRLVVSVVGAGTATDAIVTDVIPANTTYVNASMTLDDGVNPILNLTDSAADTPEPGSFDGTQIRVNTGDVPAGEIRTVTFQVTID